MLLIIESRSSVLFCSSCLRTWRCGCVLCVFLGGGGVASKFGPNMIMTMKRLFCDDKAFCLIFNKRLLEFDAENLFVLARWRHWGVLGGKRVNIQRSVSGSWRQVAELENVKSFTRTNINQPDFTRRKARKSRHFWHFKPTKQNLWGFLWWINMDKLSIYGSLSIDLNFFAHIFPKMACFC